MSYFPQTAITDTSGNAIALGQTTKSASLPVAIASDQALAVTANAGTNLNTSALALETGGNLATIASKLGQPLFSAGTTSAPVAVQLIGGKTNDGTPQYQPIPLTAGGAAVLSVATGNAASGASDSGNPIKIGGVAVNAEATAVTNGQRVNGVYGLEGKQIVLPWANKENFVSGNASATGTSDTSVIAAAGSGLKNYITSISVANSGSSATLVTIKNGSGGSTLWQLLVPAGANTALTLPVPIATSANTAVYFASGTSSSTVYCNIAGYKGT